MHPIEIKSYLLTYLLTYLLIGAFIDLFSLYVIFVLSTISFFIVRQGIAALFIILQQLIQLLLAIPLFAHVEGKMQPLSVFEVCGIVPCPHVIVFHFG